MLALAYTHEHEYRRYVLRDTFEPDGVEKEYTELDYELVPGAYFIGYDCECGDEGWAV